MKHLILKLNHKLFNWYYSRVPEHFHQWPILKSIDLLIQNYRFQQKEIDGANAVIRSGIQEEDRLRKEILNLRMQMTAKDSQIDWMNKNFGTDIKGPRDN